MNKRYHQRLGWTGICVLFLLLVLQVCHYDEKVDKKLVDAPGPLAETAGRLLPALRQREAEIAKYLDAVPAQYPASPTIEYPCLIYGLFGDRDPEYRAASNVVDYLGNFEKHFFGGHYHSLYPASSKGIFGDDEITHTAYDIRTINANHEDLSRVKTIVIVLAGQEVESGNYRLNGVGEPVRIEAHTLRVFVVVKDSLKVTAFNSFVPEHLPAKFDPSTEEDIYSHQRDAIDAWLRSLPSLH